MKSFFLSIVALAVIVASNADAACYKPNPNPLLEPIKVPPIAIADQDGVFHTKMPNGQPIDLSGFEPGRYLCKKLLFKSSPRKCPLGKAHLAEDRDPRFCEGVGGDNVCQHIVCDVVAGK
jgi:hypothetical protein